VDSNRKFSVSSDASNKNNIKLFLILIQYFSSEKAMQDFVLDFYEDPNETLSAIYENIKTKLALNGLKIALRIALPIQQENTSTNYGCHKSMFVNLQSENESIIHANCNAHVIHNSAKFGLKNCLSMLNL
jgi:hypothetical protein